MSSKNDLRPTTRIASAKGKRPWSLAMRLTIWYAGSAFAILLVATSILYWALVSNLDRQDDQFLIDEVHILQDLLAERPEYVDAIRQEVEWEAAARHYARVYERLVDGAGRTVAETPGMTNVLSAQAFPAAEAVTGLTGGVDATSRDGIPYRVLSVDFDTGASAGVRTIQVAVDRVQQRALIAKYRATLLGVLAVALAASSLAAYAIAHRGIQPITRITATVRRIRSTTLNERIDAGDVPAELSALGDTFNEMLDRLQESFERLSRFSADIAHELRTPINNLRGEAEVTLAKTRSPDEYRESLGSCLEESVRLSRMIDDLLFLARADQAATLILRKPVDVVAELERLREYFEAAADEAGIALVVHGRPNWMANIDRTLFQRAVSNLLSNAIRHTPAGGTVDIKAEMLADELVVHVTDTGEGISPAMLPHVFDRFFRADDSRSVDTGGTGLGLAIVQGIAQLHGGSVSVTSEPQRGTQLCLRLGLKQSPP